MQLKAPDRYFWELNPKTNLLEKYDSTTGKIVAIQAKMTDVVPDENLQEVRLPDGTLVLVERGVDLAALNHIILDKKHYNPVLVEIIAQKIAEGGSLTSVCKEPGMPSYATVCRWRRLHPELEDILLKARQDRAEFLRDMVLDEAYAADEDNIGPQKLRVDTLKWLAGKDDPNRFEAKPEKLQVSVAPSVIMVQTGINRSEDAADEVEVKDVHGATNGEATEFVECNSDEQVLINAGDEELIGNLGE